MLFTALTKLDTEQFEQSSWFTHALLFCLQILHRAQVYPLYSSCTTYFTGPYKCKCKYARQTLRTLTAEIEFDLLEYGYLMCQQMMHILPFVVIRMCTNVCIR